MSLQINGVKPVLCVQGHENRHDSEWCRYCGTAIMDYGTELQQFLSTLIEQESHLKFVRDRIFLGTGDQGSKLLNDFYIDQGRMIKRASFLLIDSSGDAQKLISRDSEVYSEVEYNSPLFLYRIPGSSNRQLCYYGLGERLSSNDTTLSDRLLRAGINAVNGKQTVFLVSALGGGAGSGIAPNVVERVKMLNPESNKLAIVVTPAGDEPDSAHFNAFCSLSRLIKSDHGPLADMLILIDYDRLMNANGIGSIGNELAAEAILTHMVGILSAAGTDPAFTQTDIDYFVKMSRSTGVYVYTPCIAAGRSLEIFGNLTNIMESALASSLSPIDSENITLSLAIVQIPKKILPRLKEGSIKIEINKWNKEKFPNLKGSVVQISQSDIGTDRIDLCLLLGGNRLAYTAQHARDGFNRFKVIAEKEAWEQEFALNPSSLAEFEQAVAWYDNNLSTD